VNFFKKIIHSSHQKSTAHSAFFTPCFDPFSILSNGYPAKTTVEVGLKVGDKSHGLMLLLMIAYFYAIGKIAFLYFNHTQKDYLL